MKNIMKIKTTLAMLALGATVLGVGCSSDRNCCRPPPPAGQAGGPGMKGHRPPPPSPLMQALDVNHDGVIDADEIANAPAALKTLDKNGDGKLTPDELCPARPPHKGGPPESGNDKPPGPPPGDK
jgi:hypothetical protein